jgi:hypothetical protein
MILSRIRKKFGLYDLRKEGTKWVRKNLGEEWVQDFCEKYDNINRGIPIGGFAETAVFIDMVERIKQEI